MTLRSFDRRLVLKRKGPDTVSAKNMAKDIARTKAVDNNIFAGAPQIPFFQMSASEIKCAYAGPYITVVSRDVGHLMRILTR